MTPTRAGRCLCHDLLGLCRSARVPGGKATSRGSPATPEFRPCAEAFLSRRVGRTSSMIQTTSLPCMIEVFPYADEADERRGLDVYNAVWPHDRVGLDEVRAYRASLRDYVDLLARIDGTVAGFALAAIAPQRPEQAFALVTVLPELRGRGTGTALYEAVSAWARERSLGVIETIVADNDPESLAFTQRRDFTEEGHELGLSLDLTRIEPPIVEPPEGVRIVTWGERPRAGPPDLRGCA